MKHDSRATYTAQSFDHLRGLDGISDAQITEHLELYAGYVKQVNALMQEQSEIRTERRASGKDFGLGEATWRLAFEYDGMVLHEYYFTNLKPGGAARPSERQALGRRLAETFGSVDQWMESFKAMAALRGVGWVILFQDEVTDRLINHWVSLHHDGILARCKPLLVMDVWEHAFVRDYKATERAKYVEAFLKNVDWSIVDRRFAEDADLRIPSAA
jgi:superoxide dismutase, Fe-Mn family